MRIWRRNAIWVDVLMEEKDNEICDDELWRYDSESNAARVLGE